MIRDFLIFFVGVWGGVIIGLFLAGSLHANRRADADRTELDNTEPPVRVPPKAKEPPVFINTIGKD
jgi:hypothetical protein